MKNWTHTNINRIDIALKTVKKVSVLSDYKKKLEIKLKSLVA